MTFRAGAHGLRRRRGLVVTSAPTLTYTSILVLSGSERVRAVDEYLLLYSADDQTVRMRDTAAGAELALQDRAIAKAGDWQVGGGVAAVGQGNDCTVTCVCVYSWRSGSARVNLSAANPWAGTTFQRHPELCADHVIWCNNARSDGGGSYSAHQISTGLSTRVDPASGINNSGNADSDIAVAGAVVSFVHWGQTGGSGPGSTFSVYRWSSDPGISTRLSSAGMSSIYSTTDDVPQPGRKSRQARVPARGR